MTEGLEHLDTDYDKAEYFKNMLIERATGGSGNPDHYVFLRESFLSNPAIRTVVPRWIKVNNNLSQFWQFIKHEYKKYTERSAFINEEFIDLLDFLQSNEKLPPEKAITNSLDNFSSSRVNDAWKKALDRKNTDPEGAITISRTMLETVCKHILDASNVEYNKTNIDFSELYKATAKLLNLAPEQHSERILKQILGGCSAIINGVSVLRNKLGDAHGKGELSISASARHAELAVNLAGSMALFLIQTFDENKKS